MRGALEGAVERRRRAGEARRPRAREPRRSCDIDGTPKAYAVKGELDVGPPDELDARGARLHRAPTARADLAQLELRQTRRAAGVERHGGVQARRPGTCTPRRSDFNPGALLARWPGQVEHRRSARAASSRKPGRAARCRSRRCRARCAAGRSRARAIIEFAAPSQLAGDLRVSSGKSRIAVKGERGSRSRSMPRWSSRWRRSTTGCRTPRVV